MRFIILAIATLGAVFLLVSKQKFAQTSVDSVSESSSASLSLRQRQAKEDESTTGRTFTFYLSQLEGDKTGEVVIQTHPEWAPLGVAQFHKLVDEGFYKDCRFFRVVPNFMVQFGISGYPGKFPEEKPLKDDPVKTTNARGTVTFATSGANTRTTQLFINTNTKGNGFLDNQGFSPFGEVLSGMEFIDQIYSGYGEEPSQGKIEHEGNTYLEKQYPLLSFISDTKSLEQADDETAKDGGH